MAKVRCKYCKYEVAGKCIKKKATVKLNKRRNCAFYEGDEQKIVESKTVVKKADTAVKSTDLNKVNIAQFGTTANLQHPLTGDLSKFVKE